jgi:hypothetical protein
MMRSAPGQVETKGAKAGSPARLDFQHWGRGRSALRLLSGKSGRIAAGSARRTLLHSHVPGAVAGARANSVILLAPAVRASRKGI